MTVNTFGSLPKERSGRTAATWLWPFIPISFSAFSLSALVYYHLHHGMQLQSPLQMLYAGIYDAFGLAPSVMFFLLTLTWSSIWFATGTIERPGSRLARLAAMAVMLGIFLNLGTSGVAADVHKGQLGAWLAGILVAGIGPLPSLVLVWAITFASLLLATDFFFSDRFERLLDRTEPAGDAGVEPAVAEHLRTLAAVVTPPAEPVSVAPTEAPAVVLPTVASLDTVGGDLDAAEPVVLRRSYAERAAERAARREAARAEAEAPPVAPSPAEATEEAWPMPSMPLESVGTVPEAAAEATAEAPEDFVIPSASEFAVPSEPVSGDEVFVIEPTQVAPWSAAEPEVVGDTKASAEVLAAVDAANEVQAAEPAELVSPVEAPFAVEPTVTIPRPESRPEILPAVTIERVPSEEPARQQSLFGGGLDEVLLQDAIDVVSSTGRASVSLLQRKLRIDYPLACDVLAALAARGIIALDGDTASGRVIS